MTPITYRLANGAEIPARRAPNGRIVIPGYRIHPELPPTFAPDGTNLDVPAYERTAHYGRIESSNHEKSQTA